MTLTSFPHKRLFFLDLSRYLSVIFNEFVKFCLFIKIYFSKMYFFLNKLVNLSVFEQPEVGNRYQPNRKSGRYRYLAHQVTWTQLVYALIQYKLVSI